MLKYIKIGFYSLKEVFYYSYMIVLSNVHLLFLVLVLTCLTLFGAHSKGVDNIGGIALGFYARYVFITELVMINWQDKSMIDEIKSGSIITFLTKPISFIGFYFSQTYFKSLINIVIVALFCGIIMFIFIGKFPRFGIEKFILFIVSFLIGIGLLALVSLMIALFAFIFEDSTFIRLLINKLYFIFGGLFFPLDIYPTRMKTIANFFPFKYYLYAPAKFFTTGDLSFFRSYIPFQIMWLVILFIMVHMIYSRAVRRLEINGG